MPPMEGRAPASKRLTAEEFEAGGSRYDLCELWDGVVQVHEAMAGWGGVVGGRIFVPLGQHVRSHGLGWVFLPEQGFLVARHPDRVLVPDVSFVARSRLPALPRRGFLPLAPDFAVEVRSSWDRWRPVLEKCATWIRHGVPVVWAVDPEQGLVVALRPGEAPREARPGDVLGAAPVLPDFRVAVADLFEGLA